MGKRNKEPNSKRRNSFGLLFEAVMESKYSMWISIQVLLVITIILATIFYFAEYNGREDYNYWNSLVWAFTRYIEDPGEFSNIRPATTTGRWMATLIGIIGILIFAVPAGLIGGAFTKAIENEERKKHLDNIGNKLKKSFRRMQDPKTGYRVIPRYVSIANLMTKKNMQEQDVVDAVRQNSSFRLRNLANSEIRGSHAMDRIVVEMFPHNTDYGCCIDRHSDITIVCPTGYSEAAIGNFSYYLALIGGFNFISKEYEVDPDEPSSYYIIKDENKEYNLKLFMNDLRRMVYESDCRASIEHTGEDRPVPIDKRWTVILISSESIKENEIHIVTRTYPKTGIDSLILDHEGFDRLWENISNNLEAATGFKADLNIDDLRPIGSKNLAYRIGGGVNTNVMVIRISSEVLVWNPRYLVLAKELAGIFAATLGESYTESMTDDSILKSSGEGFQ